MISTPASTYMGPPAPGTPQFYNLGRSDSHSASSRLDSTYRQSQLSASSRQRSSGRAECDVVAWKYDLDEASRAAAELREPFVIYFCSERAARLSGAGEAAWAAARKADDDGELPAPTIFEDAATRAALACANLKTLVKIPATAATAEVFKQYGASPNTLLVCGADGVVLKRFSGFDCSSATVRKYFRETFKGDCQAGADNAPLDLRIAPRK